MSQTVTPRWLTLGNKGTASQYCSLSRSTLWKAIKDGKIATRMVDGRRLIDRESLDAWIQGAPAK